jgi:hypothetical protein
MKMSLATKMLKEKERLKSCSKDSDSRSVILMQTRKMTEIMRRMDLETPKKSY